MYKCGLYQISDKKAISAGIYSYTISCPEVAALAKPGQFVHIKAEGFMLRRPISICDIDNENGSITIVFEVRGDGTEQISRLNVGDNIDMIAPLGNGFTIYDNVPDDKKIIVVGGGIGVPPIFGVAKQYGNKAIAVTGFRSYDKIILADKFKQIGVQHIICTDDGSTGEKGVVTEPLKKLLEQKNIAAVYACGPEPMLRAIVNLTLEYDVECEVSLEQRMACGVGACVGCACKIKRAGREFTLRVCKDGPIFKAEEVVL